ncbi:T9SS type A sorting domain-containing protein [bacterium]|nr:T9SS type A sorting domain-containing protein [bacterium]
MNTRYHVVLSITLALLVVSALQAQPAHIGPPTAWVNCIEKADWDSDVLYAGLWNGGLYTRDNSSEAWRFIGTGLPLYPASYSDNYYPQRSSPSFKYIDVRLGWYLPIAGVETCASRPNELWVWCQVSEEGSNMGTGTQLFFSSDNGESWELRNTGLDDVINIKSLWRSSSHPDTLWAHASGDIDYTYWSGDNGLHWEQTDLYLMNFQDHPFYEDGVLARGVLDGVEGSFLLSLDAGETWDGSGQSYENYSTFDVRPSPVDPDVLLMAACSSNSFPETGSRYFLSRDAGSSWSPVESEDSEGYNQATYYWSAFAPNGTGFAGTDNLFYPDAPGMFRIEPIGDEVNIDHTLIEIDALLGIPPTIYDGVWAGSGGGGLYLATASGVFFSDDAGESFLPHNEGFLKAHSLGLSIAGSNGVEHSLSFGLNGVFLKSGNNPWKILSAMYSFSGVVANDGTLYMVLNDTLRKSTDQGLHWETISNQNARYGIVAIDQQQSEHILFGSFRLPLCNLSFDGGESWVEFDIEPDERYVYGGFRADGAALAASEQTIHLKVDVESEETTFAVPDGREVTAFLADGDPVGRMVIAQGNRVRRFDFASSSWLPGNGGIDFESNITDLARTWDGDGLYALAGDTIYRQNSQDDEWTIFSADEIPWPTGIETWPDGSLYVSSLTNGIWKYQVTLDVEDVPIACLPDEFTLLPPWPNPFNPSTRIRFLLGQTAEIALAVYNPRGQLVTQLAQGTYSPGSHQVEWNDPALASGIYFVRLEVEGRHQIQKIARLK